MDKPNSELANILNSMGFYTPATKFKKILGGVYFRAPCKYGYELVDENDNPIVNICKKVKFAPVYKVLSIDKLIRAPYTNVCVEAMVLKSDVDEGEPHCATCPNYIKNVAEKIKNEILVKSMKLKKQ